jgi:hypothetical protein
MRWFLLLAAGLLFLGCGQGTKVEIVNETGADLAAVTLTLGGATLAWDLIKGGESVSRRITLPAGGEWSLSYTSGSFTVTDSNVMPDSSDRASSITLFISGESTGLVYHF